MRSGRETDSARGRSDRRAARYMGRNSKRAESRTQGVYVCVGPLPWQVDVRCGVVRSQGKLFVFAGPCVCVCVFDSVIGVGRGMEDLLISIVPVTFGLL